MVRVISFWGVSVLIAYGAKYISELLLKVDPIFFGALLFFFFLISVIIECFLIDTILYMQKCNTYTPLKKLYMDIILNCPKYCHKCWYIKRLQKPLPYFNLIKKIPTPRPQLVNQQYGRSVF